MIDSNILNLGILAHVDAGKTTLSESLLYTTGTIRKAGRVDHGDAFLDTFDIEKKRGITIFSKQARMEAFGREITLLDTPGHVDFSPEMERTLGVLDAAILVISAADGVGAQVRTLWKLLEHYGVPAFIFVNKMDQPGADMERLEAELRDEFGSNLVNVQKGTDDPEVAENIAVCDDELMERYLETEELTDEDISRLVAARRLFPMLFGSALKMEGVEELLSMVCRYIPAGRYPDEFGARVYKIMRGEEGERLALLKVTGGSLNVRDSITTADNEGNPFESKIAEIRLYSGGKYKLVTTAPAGTVCAVLGLPYVRAGEGLGGDLGKVTELIEPILNCRIILTDDADPYKVWQYLTLLQEEEPGLSVSRMEDSGDIYVRVMGTVQKEIIKNLMNERYGVAIDFGEGQIVYKETIDAPVEGVGHFEPLRHYAEVHLMLEPTGPGSGLSFAMDCPRDLLALNWQRLIMTHLAEKKHRGVLTGAEITDMRITVIGGKAHLKHTEGGDFRQATYRAVRQGLMMAGSILLEPYYRYEIDLPRNNLGRAMSDLQQMYATISSPVIEGDRASITGSLPAACLGDYAETLRGYTSGEGRMECQLSGYEPCHNAEEIIRDKGYDPELDEANPCYSVFCSHGAGTPIPWNMVRSMMHVDTGWRPAGEIRDGEGTGDDAHGGDNAILSEYTGSDIRSFTGSAGERIEEELTFSERRKRIDAANDELKAIFERTYGPIKERSRQEDRVVNVAERKEPGISDPKYAAKAEEARRRRQGRKADSYLLIDGYNVLFASPELKALAERDINGARDKLMDILSNYQGYCRETLILVFDAYKVKGGQEHVYHYHNLCVIYTKEAETADQYIEKASGRLQHEYNVTVASSDSIEQVIIMGKGAVRLPAADFWKLVSDTEQTIRDEHLIKNETRLHNYVIKEGDLES
ncbi:translation factor GTPase family protein [Butyrivibrio sp. MC2013]|uniref:translation factor GTPase family protein n=1 Tax=Butyrivibrio sp. MC2013 TaxID=1280686 RepID=UPI000411C7E6|nr:TetM/TetW/TetO/TetS family tetracycline resistance ribosomal protection protein [Butyrivibrio sp. MC2013]